MKKRFLTYPSADGKTAVHAVRWEPDGQPDAVLQFVHGMYEHTGRYERFARFLAESGFLVVACDLLGHGDSLTGPEKRGYFGHPDGNGFLLTDIHSLRESTAKALPGVPYFLLGFSMGSYLVRQYIALHGEGLSGAIVMGTGSQPGIAVVFGKLFCRMKALLHGWEFRSVTAAKMTFFGYNRRIKPVRTRSDWITRDRDRIDEYLADEKSDFIFTVNGLYQMFRSVAMSQKKSYVRRTPLSLPILLVSGANDPVGAYGKGVKKAFRLYRKLGYAGAEMKLYPDDRHDVLNELDRETVFADLLSWMLCRTQAVKKG